MENKCIFLKEENKFLRDLQEKNRRKTLHADKTIQQAQQHC